MAASEKQMSEADDLEYHITFPSPLPPEFTDENDGDDGEEEAAAALEPTPEPVVILLGWMACEDKHLTKYSDFYARKSCITIRYTAATEDLFRTGSRMRNIARKILELIQELDLEDNPVIFHVFSNGGCYIYRHISQLLHTEKSFAGIQVKGCVLDSCPCPRTLRNAAQALMFALPVHATAKYFITFAILAYLVVMRSLQWIGRQMGMRLESTDQYWADMEEDKARWPQLFLYSQADPVVDYQCITQLVEHRKKLGVDVTAQCWDDSPHVLHFRTHREAYVKQCYDFLDKCLQQQ